MPLLSNYSSRPGVVGGAAGPLDSFGKLPAEQTPAHAASHMSGADRITSLLGGPDLGFETATGAAWFELIDSSGEANLHSGSSVNITADEAVIVNGLSFVALSYGGEIRGLGCSLQLDNDAATLRADRVTTILGGTDGLSLFSDGTDISLMAGWIYLTDLTESSWFSVGPSGLAIQAFEGSFQLNGTPLFGASHIVGATTTGASSTGSTASISFHPSYPLVTINGAVFSNPFLESGDYGFIIDGEAGGAGISCVNGSADLAAASSCRLICTYDGSYFSFGVGADVRVIDQASRPGLIYPEFLQIATPANTLTHFVEAFIGSVFVDLGHATTVSTYTISVVNWMANAPIGATVTISSRSAINTLTWTTTGNTVRGTLPASLAAGATVVLKKVSTGIIARVS